MESTTIPNEDKLNENNETFDPDNFWIATDWKKFFCKKHESHEDAAVRIVKQIFEIEWNRTILESRWWIRWSSRVWTAIKEWNVTIGNPLVLPRSINDEIIPPTYAQIDTILKEIKTIRMGEKTKQEIIDALFSNPKDSISAARKNLFGI